MEPDDVPLHFTQETIQYAITVWLFGATIFEGGDSDALSQIFAIHVGRRLRAELDGDTGHDLTEFAAALSRQLGRRTADKFTAAGPQLNEAYPVLVAQADQDGVDLLELTVALEHIAVVRAYFAKLQSS